MFSIEETEVLDSIDFSKIYMAFTLSVVLIVGAYFIWAYLLEYFRPTVTEKARMYSYFGEDRDKKLIWQDEQRLDAESHYQKF